MEAQLTPATVVVLVTTPRGKGGEIARRILEKRLAACVNVASVHSLYWWRGRIEEDDEDLLVIKTTIDLVQRLAEELRRVHPYEVPEMLVIPVVTGLKSYTDWVEAETRQARGES